MTVRIYGADVELDRLEIKAEDYWHAEEGAPVVILEFGGEDDDGRGRLAYLTEDDATAYLEELALPATLPHPHDWCEARLTHSVDEWADLMREQDS